MTIVHRLAAVLLACAAALPAAAQEAQQCAAIEKQFAVRPLAMVQLLERAGCLERENRADPATSAVLDLVASRPAEDQHQRVDQAMRQIAGYVDTAARTQPASSQPLLSALAAEIETTRRRAAQQALGDHDVKGWEWGGASFRGLPSIDLASLNVNCAQPDEAPCKAAAGTAKLVLRAAALVRETLKFNQSGAYEDAVRAARVRESKWNSYFDDARLQFPWELYVNGLRYGRENRSAGGFAETPSDQIIFLHPGVGMEYVRGAPSGSRFQPALVLELVGYNRWTWTREGKIENAFGASLVQTYSDRAGLSSSRRGVMFHLQNKYSLAVTSSNGKTGFLMSIDLAKLVNRVEDDARSQFRLSGSGGK